MQPTPALAPTPLFVGKNLTGLSSIKQHTDFSIHDVLSDKKLKAGDILEFSVNAAGNRKATCLELFLPKKFSRFFARIDDSVFTLGPIVLRVDVLKDIKGKKDSSDSYYMLLHKFGSVQNKVKQLQILEPELVNVPNNLMAMELVDIEKSLMGKFKRATR